MSTLVREELQPGPGLWPALEAAWRDLLGRTHETSAFLSAEWIGSCVERFGEPDRPRGILWRDSGGAPVGAVLLWPGQRRLGPFVLSQVLLNSPDIAGLGCEHNDVLTVPEYRSEILADLVEILLSTEADEVALKGVRERLFFALRPLWPRPAWDAHPSESPFVDLASLRTMDERYLSQVSSNTRAQVKRSRRLYEERCGDSILDIAATPEEVAEWFDAMLELHDARWRAAGSASGFAPGGRDFHAGLLGRFHADHGSDRLRADLVRIRFGGQIVGYLYHLVYRGHVRFVQSGFHYEDDNRLKPGLICHAISIENCLARGADSYDFLGGEPEAVRYKRSLSTEHSTLYWASFPAPTKKVDALSWLRRILRRRHEG